MYLQLTVEANFPPETHLKSGKIENTIQTNQKWLNIMLSSFYKNPDIPTDPYLSNSPLRIRKTLVWSVERGVDTK